jgi:hypothetical protein
VRVYQNNRHRRFLHYVRMMLRRCPRMCGEALGYVPHPSVLAIVNQTRHRVPRHPRVLFPGLTT